MWDRIRRRWSLSRFFLLGGFGWFRCRFGCTCGSDFGCREFVRNRGFGFSGCDSGSLVVVIPSSVVVPFPGCVFLVVRFYGFVDLGIAFGIVVRSGFRDGDCDLAKTTTT